MLICDTAKWTWLGPSLCRNQLCLVSKALFLSSHLYPDWVWIMLSVLYNLEYCIQNGCYWLSHALHIKRAQHRHIGIIHSGNRGLQDHQMNIKPLIKAKLWHDTLPGSWAASPNKKMLDGNEKWRRGWDVSMFYSWAKISLKVVKALFNEQHWQFTQG